MITDIGSYYIDAVGPIEASIGLTVPPAEQPPFPPGTTVHATISISHLDTLFEGRPPDPTFSASAFIDSWTVHQPDGSESSPESGSGFTQNSVHLENCARINFLLFVQRAWAVAEVNVFTL